MVWTILRNVGPLATNGDNLFSLFYVGEQHLMLFCHIWNVLCVFKNVFTSLLFLKFEILFTTAKD